MNRLQLLPGNEKSPNGPRERSESPSGSKKSGQPHPRFAWRRMSGADPGHGQAEAQSLRQRYDRLRAELETLMAQPVRDLPRIHHLVDELELVQLRFKGALGIEGNNPNE